MTVPTVTIAEADAVPPLPVQLIEYVVVTEGDDCTEPLVPVAVKLVPVQEVALLLDQVSVVVCPTVMELGVAENVTVGGGGVVALPVLKAAIHAKNPPPEAPVKA